MLVFFCKKVAEYILFLYFCPCIVKCRRRACQSPWLERLRHGYCLARKRRLEVYMKCSAFVAAIVLLLVGCVEKKTTISQAEFKDSKVYVDDAPFTGEVWSDDGMTWCLESEAGEMVGFTLYHSNESKALTLTSPDSLKAFSANGVEISLDSFNNAYKSLAQEIPELAGLIKGSKE